MNETLAEANPRGRPRKSAHSTANSVPVQANSAGTSPKPIICDVPVLPAHHVDPRYAITDLGTVHVVAMDTFEPGPRTSGGMNVP